jgi:secreted Zn-dependent insulinase-like peptidase
VHVYVCIQATHVFPVMSIHIAHTYTHTVTRDPHAVSVAIKNYYQCGVAGIKTKVLTELLAAMMSEPCFDYLRTKVSVCVCMSVCECVCLFVCVSVCV